MRITPITREQNSVPVFKNIVYGLRLGFMCDKNLFLGYLLSQIMANIFSMYLQNILFLKILLEVIDGNGNFGTYVKYLVAFVAFSSLILIAEWTGARMHQFATKKVLKIINNMIFKKANSLDVSCFEDPAFYDKYQRAVLVVTNSYFDMICYDAADLLSGIVSLVFVVGTIAAGVAKCHADVVLISGYDGGTGAAPLNAIKHAGTPWEIGLSETQQTLILNGLRSRIVVQCDGELKTGRDVVIAALLGAEEFGFATAALIVEGCVMMRACQKNTCPQGIATQDPELRARFKGKPEYVVNFFMFIAEEVREILAQLGFRTLEEAIGHVECLDQDEAIKRWKSGGIDLTNVLKQAGPVPGTILHQTIEQNHELEKALDNKLIELAQPALEHKEPVRIEMPIRNVNRTVGTMVGYEITRRYGEEGLPDDTIDMTLHGSGGQSIGAFIPRGETMRIYGEVNDYAGKGLSGGRMIVRPEDTVTFDKHSNVIAGNVTGFGATSGQMFVAGRAGERFGVRNGGATFVVEGVGDHGCEYMTGGTVVVLGPTGRNFGAGFSGGNTYVLDLDMKKVNPGAIKSGALLFKSLDAETSKLVYALVKQHAEETGSQFAAALLEDWNETVKRFTHVVPKQFVAMTKAMEEAKANNVDFNAPGAWEKVYEQVMEGAR